MSRERYELLKSEANFDVMSYEKYSEIFGNLNLSHRMKTGDLTHKKELDFLAENNVEEIYKNNEKYLNATNLNAPSSHDCRDT